MCRLEPHELVELRGRILLVMLVDEKHKKPEIPPQIHKMLEYLQKGCQHETSVITHDAQHFCLFCGSREI